MSETKQKIDPGAGWEFIPKQEYDLAPKSMEYEFLTDDGNGWWPLYNDTGQTLQYWSEEIPGLIAFRRKSAPKPAENGSGWVSILGFNLPERGQSVWFNHEQKGVLICRHFAGVVKGWTHWKPLRESELPAPPKPEPTPAEKAWSDHLVKLNERHDFGLMDLFHAKFNFDAGFSVGRGK